MADDASERGEEAESGPGDPSDRRWDEATVADIADAMGRADHAVALTGAGVSTASGIPDFRSEGGIWDQFDPERFRYGRFRADPEGFWSGRVEMHEAAFGGDISPNAAHEALADLESRGLLDAVVTQNIDGLHHEAGTDSVVELHGTTSRVVCEDCGGRFDADGVHERVREGECPPRCDDCDGVLKPDVVLFGEQLPQGALQTAQQHARTADFFLAAGSSLTVQPAASLPRVASRNGTLVVVNFDRTPVSETAAYDLRADVTEVLPALADAVDAV